MVIITKLILLMLIFHFINSNNIYFRHALTAAASVLEGVKRANSFGTEIGQEIAKYGLGGLIDIQAGLYYI